MKKLLTFLFCSLLTINLYAANQYKTRQNPFTGKPDYVLGTDSLEVGNLTATGTVSGVTVIQSGVNVATLSDTAYDSSWNGITTIAPSKNAIYDAGFLTGNQNITLSGDVSGSGTTAITTTIGADKVNDTHIDWGTGANQVNPADFVNQDIGDITVTSGDWAVENDSHNHTSTTLPATTSYLGSSIEESEISLSDNTTANASTSAHGFLKKLSNNAGQYMDGTGNWSSPSGSGDVLGPATNTDNYVPQWNGANSKTLKDGLAVPFTVSNGGTGLSTATTAYGVVCAGTTATGAFQVLNSLGSSGQVLTSNGAGALPSFQAVSAGANTALSNLASVAINLSLTSDTDNTDSLGTEAIHWKDLFLSGIIKSGTSGAEIAGGKGAETQLNKLLIHFNGTDGATSYTAETGQTLTFGGNAQLDTAQSKFGGSSFLLDGTTDYITVPDSDDWNLGTNDFTFRFWIRYNTLTDNYAFHQFIDANNRMGCEIYDGDNKLYFFARDGGTWRAYYATTNAQTWTLGTWYHIEIARSGSTCYMFKDGTSLAVTETTAFGTLPDLATTLNIGARDTSYGSVDGWIDEFEFYKGIALHTSNFTVPAKESGGTLETANLYARNALGIGTTSPSTPLDILANDNATAQTIKINVAQASVTASDTFIDFRSTTGSEGSIAGTASAGVIAYNTFTGSHFTQIIDKTGLEPNMLLEIVDEDILDFPSPKRAYEINELEKDAEDKPIIIGTTKDNLTGKEMPIYKTKKVTKTETLPYKASPKRQLFKSQICKTKASKKAIGVYLGTDKEGRDMIGSIGTGFIWVANKGKNIEVGDYLESSNMLGCVELQNDTIYRNTTVAKATESITWNQGEQKRQIRCIYLGG